jgi:small-conductance mechanosensitive channel
MNFQPVLDSLGKIVTDILDFIPRFINGLIILLVGYAVSVLVRTVVGWVLRRIRLDQLAERTGITSALRGLGIRAPLPRILSQIVFFFLILSFATAAVELMGLSAVAELLQNVLRFVPRAISAALLLIFGSMLARFLGNTVSAVAENVNINYSTALGRIIEYAIVIFSAVLAISTLGVDTSLLTSSLTIIVASVGLAIALTFGLGSRDAARNVIAGYYVRQQFTPGQQVTLGNYSGTVRSTSGAYTALEVTGEDGAIRTISLPNTLLLQEAAVAASPAPPASPPPAPPASDTPAS